eukprot:4328362-Pleurochrysis_carterae.AAC.1
MRRRHASPKVPDRACVQQLGRRRRPQRRKVRPFLKIDKREHLLYREALLRVPARVSHTTKRRVLSQCHHAIRAGVRALAIAAQSRAPDQCLQVVVRVPLFSQGEAGGGGVGGGGGGVVAHTRERVRAHVKQVVGTVLNQADQRLGVRHAHVHKPRGLVQVDQHVQRACLLGVDVDGAV